MKKNYLFVKLLLFAFLLLTVTAHSQSPGGVPANLNFWLKADAQVNTASGKVTSWLDQSGGGFNATQATLSKQPGYTVNNILFNGNPSVDFDLTDDAMPTTASITSGAYSFYVVYNSTNTNSGPRRAIQGSTNWLIGPYQNVASFYAGTFVDPRNIPVGTSPSLSTATSTGGSSNNAAFYYNGKTINSAVTSATAPGTINLGAAGLTTERLGGSIAEVIAYTSVLTVPQQNQVESYLAFKYGITLDQTTAKNYVNSAGLVRYASATSPYSSYAKDVAGIIRDDGSGLNQSTSTSANLRSVVTIASTTTLTNNDYFIAGNDGSAIELRSNDAPGSTGPRLKRVWKITKTANPATVTIRMFIGDIPELVNNPNISNVALLVNSNSTGDTSFSGATAITGGTLIGPLHDTIEFTGVTMNDGDYFTLGLGGNTVVANDFEFWFGVPLWQSSINSPQKIHFTGVSATNYSIYIIDMPADPTFTPIIGTVSPASAKIIDMTPYINAITSSPSNTVLNKGLRIRIEGKMGAYYADENSLNYGTFPLRGPNALGTSFYIPGQTLRQNASSAYVTEFVVTAAFDGTVITITPSEAITGHGANVPFDVSLNKGQTYVAQSLSTGGKQLGGSLVTSTKPVVITYSEDYVSGTGSSLDNMGDQLVPLSKLGNDYVHIRTSLSNNANETVFITGTQNGTTVTTFDGTTTNTLVLDAGVVLQYNLPSGINAASIKSDKPISVYQMGGSGNELGGGILTPVGDCKGTSFIAFQYPASATTTYFNFVTTDALVGSFLLNGSNSIIQAGDFFSVPGIPGWKYCRKNVTGVFSQGQVINIQNTGGKFYFYQNIESGANQGGDFSNFSDFGNVVLFPVAEHTCGSTGGTTISLKSGTIAFNVGITAYNWTGPDGFTSALSDPVINNVGAANMGTYTVTVTDDENCSFSEKVIVNLPVTSLTVTPNPSAPCVGSTVRFTSVSTPAEAVAKKISWTGPNGFTSSQANFDITGITAAQSGTYTCTYIDMYDCPITKSTTITVSSDVLAQFTVAGNAKLNCTNPATTLTITSVAQGINYETYNPYDASSLFASSNFTVITPGFYNQQPATSGAVLTTPLNLNGLSGITAASLGYGVTYKGFINITNSGNYTFYTNSKDGSNLYIDGSLLVSNDGSHALTEVASTATSLSVGYHAIEVNYFNGAAGTASLAVSYQGPDMTTKNSIPASVLFYATGAAPAGLTYTWTNDADATTVTGNSITTSTPAAYTVNGSNGTCSSNVSYKVIGIDSYDYGDLSVTWPSAQAKIVSCLTAAHVPSGSTNGAVWAGKSISLEATPYRSATASLDTFDDGFTSPTSAGAPYNVLLNTNTPATAVNYGLWFDWNNNGNFADDVDIAGNPAFYSGNATISGITTVPITVLRPTNAASIYAVRLVVASIPVVFTAYDDIFANGEVEDYTTISSLSGTVFDDANGLNGTPSNTINGTGTNAGGLIAILVNSIGNVVANATVATDGTYSFSTIEADTYSIVLSTTSGTIGSVPPAATLPAGWVNTGENLGSTAGTDGTVNGILTGIQAGAATIVNANFGINNRPTADAITSCLSNPGGTNQGIVTKLTGSDPEDGTYNGTSNTNTITIVTLPTNGILYYNAIAATAGQIIPNYNPGLLTLDPNDGNFTLTFNFNEIDAAGTPSAAAVVTLYFTAADSGADFTKTCIQNPTGKSIGNTAIAGVTYSWSPATGLSSATVSNPTANPVATTTYTLTTTNTANTCTATDTVIVTVDTTVPVANAGSDFTKTCTQNPTGKTIGTTAVTGVTYVWSPATGLSTATASNPTANPTVTTTYTLTSTNTASGCTASDQVIVTVDTTVPVANAGTDFTKTCTQNPTGKTIGTTAVTGVTYSWSPATGLSSATASNPTANPTATTTYTLTSTNTASGCTATATVIVTVDTTVPAADAGTDFTKSCTQNPTGKTIGNTAVTGVTYSWSPATGLSSSTASNPTANPAATTTYTLTSTNTASGCTATNNIIVTVDTTVPVANAGSDFTKTCTQNPTGKTIGTTAVTGVTYSWSPASGLSSATASNPTANPTATTTYTLTSTNTASGCTATATVIVTVDTTVPVADAGNDFTKSCTQNPTGKTIGTTAVTGVTYSWSPASGLSSATASNPTANPTATTTYTLTSTNTASGCTATDTVIVTVDTTVPVANAGAGFTKSCTQNSSGKTIGTTTVSGVTYVWSPATGLSSAAVSNPTANPTATTTYTLTSTNTASGCTATDQVIVTVDSALPIADAGADFTKTCTQNPTGKTIGTTAVTGVTYSWSPATGLSSSAASNPTANPTATTTYTLTSTDNASGCTASDQVIVTVDTTVPVANAGTDFTKTCTQNPTGKTIGTTTVSGVTYVWNPATGLSSAAVSNPTANPTATTTYTLTSTNTASGCTATDQVTVTVDSALPVADAGADFTKTCTQNSAGKTIGTTTVTGVTYSWSPATGLSSAAVSNPTANPTATTTYTLTSTDTTSGCTASDEVVVTVDTTIPVADAGTDFTKTCIQNPTGKTIGTTTVSGVTYAWSPATGLSSAAVSNPTANPTASTTYTLISTNTASGCTATNQVIVTVNTTAPNAGSDTTVYIGASTTLSATGSGNWTADAANPGTVTIAAPTSANTMITDFTVAGTYNFIWTITNGCTDTASVVASTSEIIAVTDDFSSTPINGSNGGNTASVLDNDTLNGSPINPLDINLTSTGLPTGATLNPDGTITIGLNTPAGDYVVTYTVCEKLNPLNCNSNTVNIKVAAAPLIVVADDFSSTPINGSNGGNTASVLVNDTLNGAAINPSDVNLTATGLPTGATLNPDGTITIGLNTPAGDYVVTYTVCEKLNPLNCNSNTVNIKVAAAPLIVVADDFSSTPINGSNGGNTASVLDNDTLNGAAINPSDVNLTSTGLPTGATLNPDGTITIGLNTPAGDYVVTYTVCEKLNPLNCNSNTVNIKVAAAPLIVVADDFSATPINGSNGGNTASVLDNDTLNGAVINPSDVNLTSTGLPTGATLNTDGTITIGLNTPAGDYVVRYTVCEKLNPLNCNSNTVNVKVNAALLTIVPHDFSATSINGSNGGNTTSVLDNGTLNGILINPLSVTITQTGLPNGAVINPDGTILIAPNTTPGSYTVNYTVCEKLNPTNCVTNTALIKVAVKEAPSIAIIKTAVFNDANGNGYAEAGETITYHFEVSNTGNMPLTNVMITDPLPGVILTGGPVALAVGEQDTASFVGEYVIKQTDINKGNVTNQATVSGSTFKGLVVSDRSDDNSNDGDNPTILSLSGCVIVVFNAVSPNGDGLNDTLDIQGIGCFPDNSVEIYNRWGVLVFKRDNYNNADISFKGISEGRTTIDKSDLLPVGTYFYIIKYKDNAAVSHDLSGYLFLNRQ